MGFLYTPALTSFVRPPSAWDNYDAWRALSSDVLPTPGGKDKTLNLWKVRRDGETWETPAHLPPSVNAWPYAFAPSVARDGTIYFMGSTKNHRHQLYRAFWRGDAYERAEPLAFSSPATKDADPLVAPDQSYVLFVSAGRGGANDSNAHIYVARATGSSWNRSRRSPTEASTTAIRIAA